MIEGVYRYARIDRMPDFLAMGWIDHGLLPGPHGAWSFMVRACVCNPEGKAPTR